MAESTSKKPKEAQAVSDQNLPELDRIQGESEAQALPEQEKVFRVAKRIRSKLHNLPDPTNPPLGFTPGKGFDGVFPFIKLPDLAPNLNGDWVQFGSPDLEPNRLYYGDNLQVLRTLDSNSIDLIYIDPPFFSDQQYTVIWGDTNEVRTFSDMFEGGLHTYLIWLNARLWEMRRVLKETGTICVHCDWHASHYIKAEMDRIFGYGEAGSGGKSAGFRNEVVWAYGGSARGAKAIAKQLGRNHDVLLVYAKGSSPKYTPYYVEKLTHRKDIAKEGYQVGPDGVPFKTAPRGDYTDDSIAALDREGRIHRTRTGGIRIKYPLEIRGDYIVEQKMVGDVWTDIPDAMHLPDAEDFGYPTQKPEKLLERIIAIATERDDVVADFFCGGGSTPVVAQKQGRRWIACDSSRVAISVTLNRIVQAGEEATGVTSNFAAALEHQGTLNLATEEKVPDVRVHYVGVYPMDRFKAVDQKTFDRFLLKCLAAQTDNTDSAITGWRSVREPLKVGPADPDASPSARDVQAFFEACLRHLQENVKLQARYVCWRTSPDLVTYRKQLTDYVRKNVQARGADLDLDFLLVDSEEFRSRVRQKYPEADDAEFLMRFTKEPIIGEITAAKVDGARTYRFEAADADSSNIGGYLVNCQWDFDYQRGHFAAHRDHFLCRREMKGREAKAAGRKYEAVLSAEHQFVDPGKVTIACRVQDNFGAEAIRTLELEVK